MIMISCCLPCLFFARGANAVQKIIAIFECQFLLKQLYILQANLGHFQWGITLIFVGLTSGYVLPLSLTPCTYLFLKEILDEFVRQHHLHFSTTSISKFFLVFFCFLLLFILTISFVE